MTIGSSGSQTGRLKLLEYWNILAHLAELISLIIQRG